jgi:DNA polymerase-3 subunit delta
MSILYLFTRHINILIQIKELSSLGCHGNELAKRIGIPPFTVNKYGKQAGMFKRSKLLQMLETRADYEEKFKNGKLSDQLAVELFLISALTNS